MCSILLIQSMKTPCYPCLSTLTRHLIIEKCYNIEAMHQTTCSFTIRQHVKKIDPLFETHCYYLIRSKIDYTYPIIHIYMFFDDLKKFKCRNNFSLTFLYDRLHFE